MPQTAVVELAENRPRVLDTYALVYSFVLAFLVPGALSIARLPFRTYTFAYVAPVTLAFVFPGGSVRFVATALAPTDTSGLPPCFGAPGSAGTITMQAWAP